MNLSPEDQAKLQKLVGDLRDIGSKCKQSAEKYKSKGNRVEMEKQDAFAYARNSSAQMLENLINSSGE